MSALDIKDVKKSFKTPAGATFVAVDSVSLSVKEGSIHGLLGPNGAGKSTLISMVSGALLPDAGTISIFGKDIVADTVAAKTLLGVVPQEMVIEMAFTVEEVLYYFAGMYGVEAGERGARIAGLLKDLSLDDKAGEKARSLSGGMKRRLMIAKALMHRPKLLILDEPTAGVDVALRQKIWELVRRLRDEGVTIVFTTHYLEEAEQLCDTITVVNKGKVVKEGLLVDIQNEFSKNVIHFELYRHDVPHLGGVKKTGSEYEFPLADLEKDIAAVTTHYKGNIKSIRNEAASLEKIFLNLTENK